MTCEAVPRGVGACSCAPDSAKGLVRKVLPASISEEDEKTRRHRMGYKRNVAEEGAGGGEKRRVGRLNPSYCCGMTGCEV